MTKEMFSHLTRSLEHSPLTGITLAPPTTVKDLLPSVVPSTDEKLGLQHAPVYIFRHPTYRDGSDAMTYTIFWDRPLIGGDNGSFLTMLQTLSPDPEGDADDVIDDWVILNNPDDESVELATNHAKHLRHAWQTFNRKENGPTFLAALRGNDFGVPKLLHEQLVALETHTNFLSVPGVVTDRPYTLFTRAHTEFSKNFVSFLSKQKDCRKWPLAKSVDITEAYIQHYLQADSDQRRELFKRFVQDQVTDWQDGLLTFLHYLHDVPLPNRPIRSFALPESGFGFVKTDSDVIVYLLKTKQVIGKLTSDNEKNLVPTWGLHLVQTMSADNMVFPLLRVKTSGDTVKIDTNPWEDTDPNYPDYFIGSYVRYALRKKYGIDFDKPYRINALLGLLTVTYFSPALVSSWPKTLGFGNGHTGAQQNGPAQAPVWNLLHSRELTKQPVINALLAYSNKHP